MQLTHQQHWQLKDFNLTPTLVLFVELKILLSKINLLPGQFEIVILVVRVTVLAIVIGLLVGAVLALLPRHKL